MKSDKQPKALRLADRLFSDASDIEDAIALDVYAVGGIADCAAPFMREAAAELRRLHEVNAELVDALEYVIKGVPSTWVGVVKAQTILEKTKEDNNG